MKTKVRFPSGALSAPLRSVGDSFDCIGILAKANRVAWPAIPCRVNHRRGDVRVTSLALGCSKTGGILESATKRTGDGDHGVGGLGCDSGKSHSSMCSRQGG